MDELKFIAIPFLVIVAFVGAVAVGTRQFAHHYDVNDCRAFAAASGYETKFVDYSKLTWDCLVLTETGKWVRKDAVLGVNQ